MTIRALLTAGLAVCIAVAGCGGGKPSAATSTTTTGTTTTSTGATTSTSTRTTTPANDLPGSSTNPAGAKATNTQTALLTDVRAARHSGYDRVVFEFANALPGYEVRYVERPVRQDASGRVIPVTGAAIAQVRMENALDADLTKANAPMTYRGPVRFSPDTNQVRQLVRVGGFENVLTWAVGLREQTPFRVLTLDSPPRLVVDFRN